RCRGEARSFAWNSRVRRKAYSRARPFGRGSPWRLPHCGMPSDPRSPWLLLCAALAALSLLAWPLPREALNWQPALVASQPWRAITAAFVHWTPIHLAANLAGCLVIALLGWRAALGRHEMLAGLIALPMTQLGLLLRPELLRYAGLSGLL